MPLQEPASPSSAASARADTRPPLPSLRGRLILLVLLALLPLLVLTLYQLWDAHRLRTSAAHHQAAALADSLEQHHAAQLGATERILASVAATPHVAHGTAAQCRAILSPVVRAGDTFVNIVRTSLDGTIECSVEPSIQTIPAAAGPALERAISSRRLATGETHTPRLHGAPPVMPVAFPLLTPEGAISGVLLGGMRLAWFDALRSGQPALPPSTVVVLTTLGGDVIAAMPPQPDLGPTLPRQPAPGGQPEIWPGLFAGDMPRVVASTVTQGGLRITVGIAREATDAAAQEDLLMAAGVFVAALLLALIAGHGIARVLVLDPLGPLRGATARMARGDFAGRIGPPYRGPAELVDLAQAFDTMADRIAERDLELINSETKLLVKRQSEERYRTLVERAPEAIVVVAAEHVVFANKQAAEVFGAPGVRDLIGTPLDLLVGPADPLLALLEAPPWDSEPPRLIETRLHRLRGAAFWAEAALAPVDYAGRPAWHVVVRDVSDRKEVERQLAQASKLATLGEVAAGLAHELSQPMNVIRVAAEAALLDERAAPLAPSTREHLVLIGDQAAQVGEIIDHVRVFSRPEPGERSVFDAFGTARRALSFLDQQIRDDSIEIDVWFDGSHGSVDGVAVHVEQIILNLIANARDSLRRFGYSPSDPRHAGWRPRITLTGRQVEGAQQDRRVQLTVGDNGGPLDGGDLDHAFDPFFPTREGGKGASHGRGLGLSICYALATAMGGTLSVHNEGDGSEAGAVFTLSLPAALPADVPGGVPGGVPGDLPGDLQVGGASPQDTLLDGAPAPAHTPT